MRLNGTFIDRNRKQGDLTADRLVESIFSNNAQSQLYQVLKLPEIETAKLPPSPIKKFLLSRRTIPSWFDAKRINKGQQLFDRYALEMMTLLGVMALPYCYAASPGNKALYLSDKMRNAPGKRLLDTASFVIAVLTPGNLDAHATGHFHINKVRLIHALSRHFIKQHPDWNMAWGVPINQEDMAGTNLAFSYVILLGLQQSGFDLSKKEREDFIFTWRYIGYLLHIDQDLLPTTLSEASQLTAVIKKRNFKRTEEGIVLTSELLKFYQSNLPTWQARLVESQIKYHLGKEVAGYIGLPGDFVLDKISSFMGEFQSLKNMLSVQGNSYHKMLSRHLMLSQKVGR